MSKTLRPLADKVVVREHNPETTTASGLVIPDTAQEKPQQGEVLGVGPGAVSEYTGETLPLDVEVEDIVVFSRYAGTPFEFNGETLLILSARDVLAVVYEQEGE